MRAISDGWPLRDEAQQLRTARDRAQRRDAAGRALQARQEQRDQRLAGWAAAVSAALTDTQLTTAVRQITRPVGGLDRRVHAVAHRTTKVPPAERLEIERPLLGPLPAVRFDSAYREPRRVHPAIPLISWRGVRYSVPTRVLGQTVEVHQPVDSSQFTVRLAGQRIATHTQASSGSDDVWDPTHHADAVHAALTAATGRHLHPVPPPPPEPSPDTRRLAVGDGYDVATPDLAVYGDGCGCTGGGMVSP